MMNRREFVVRVGGLVLLLPAGWTVACGGDSAPADGGDGGNPPPTGGEGDTVRFTSSVDEGHTHQVTLTVASITTPPATGVRRTTTADAGHSHTVQLTEADLQAIKAGGTVTKETTLVSGHLHTFDFRM